MSADQVSVIRETHPVLYTHPPDTGCEVAPKCLECPLPQCRWDDPAGYYRQMRQQKDARILEEMKQRNLSVDEVAMLFGVTTRTIFRVSRRCKA